MKVSVIIPTYNGAHKISGVLRHLEKQTIQPDEVIVVIDGSTDGTAEMLKQNPPTLKNFKVIEQPNGGRAQVRNRGAKEANGDLLIFFDDDMEPLHDCIEQHVMHHQTYENSLLTGRLLDPENTGNSDFLKFKNYLNKKWSSGILDRPSQKLSLSNLYFSACNSSMPKRVLISLEGFNEKLNDAEDYELAFRAIDFGYDVFASSLPVAVHNDQFTFITYVKRMRDYEATQKKLSKLVPKLLQHKSSISTVTPSGLKLLLFKLLCNKWWIEGVEKNKFIWLPQSIRFKLYDMIITANGTYFPEKVKI